MVRMTDDPLGNPWRRARTARVAHRGGGKESPENTLFAFHRCLAAGADAIEFDVQGTHDGVPVILHDDDLERVGGVPRRVDTMTLDEVQEVDACATWPEWAGIATGERDPPPGFTAEHFQVPTLARFLETMPAVPCILELKDSAPLDAVAELLVRWRRGHDILVASFDDEKTERVRDQAPGIGTAPGVSGVMAWMGGRRGDHLAVNVPHEMNGRRFVNEALVARAHAEGIAVLVWTVNKTDVARDLVRVGVDHLVTDVPAGLAALFPDPDHSDLDAAYAAEGEVERAGRRLDVGALAGRFRRGGEEE